MKRVKLTGLLAKIEAVYGVDSLPVAGTDGIQLEEHIWNQVETDYLERNLRENATGNRMGRHGGAQPSGRFGKVTLSVALKGAGVAYAAAVRPELDVLLRICGLGATVTAAVGTEKIEYAPIDSAHESATLYAYSAGTLYKMVGCRGRITGVSLTAGQISRVSIEVMGLVAGNPTDVALPAITYPRKAVKPPVLAAAAALLNAIGVNYKSANWEQNLELAARPRGNAADGHAGYEVADYDPQFTIQVESPDKSVFNPWALEAAATEFPWELVTGGVQYNRAKIAGGNGQIIRVPGEEDSNLAMLGLRVRCLHGAATPAFTITFD